MAVAISWDTTIAAADLGAPPTALEDANAVSTTSTADTVALSGDFSGGTDPTMTVTVYYWDALAGAFFQVGDLIFLNPDEANLAIIDPKGLSLGFTATVTGSPSDHNLHVGTR